MKLTFHTQYAQSPEMERKPMRRNTSRIATSIALGVALTAFSPMLAGPMEQTAYAQQAKYDSKVNPFAPDSRITGIAAGLHGTDLAKAQAIFDKLHRGAPDGVTVVDGEHRAPRTASETLDDGGDCTELATVVISTLKEAGAKGRAMVVHFPNAPVNEDHMVPYVMDGKRKVVIDLQAGKLGATAQGKPTLIMDLTFDQAAEMYHREWGDDLRDKGKTQEAIKAYETALRSYGDDAYVHQNLGILYEKANEMEKSSKHFKRAREIDPTKYAQDVKRGSYNEELQAGDVAYKARKWADCARHFKNALDSGEKIRPDERTTIESFRDDCQKRVK